MKNDCVQALLLICSVLVGASSASGEDFFRERVVPILESRCVSCHNDDQPAGGFSLQSADALAESGMITPGDADGSPLVDLLTAESGSAAMPKDSAPLSDEENQQIRDWIDAGAPWPSDLRLAKPKLSDFDWWSFHPPARPSVPVTSDPWVRTPIDAFVLRQLDRNGLGHWAQADRRTLIRRLSFDLLGLPPTYSETEAFVNDPSPNAYEQLVDRFLSSEHYGERWARHWLDVVKYADTCGYDKDKLRPNAWRYRDYVIRSLNDDKPYSQFIEEQIAGDVLFPSDPDGIVGLGFLAAGPWDFIGHVEVSESKIDGKVARNLDRDDMVSNVMNTFCSVTIQCARCHDHKFDPFTQRHYYGLQAVFAAVDRADRPFDIEQDTAERRTALAAKLRQLNSELAAVRAEVDKAGGQALEDLRAQVAKYRVTAKDRVAGGLSKAPEFGYHSQIAPKAETTKWVELQLDRPTDISKVVLQACHDDFAGIGAGFGFPVRFKVEASACESNSIEDWSMIVDQTDSDFANPGLDSVGFACTARAVRRVRVTATRLAERQGDFILALAEVRLLDAASRPIDLGGEVHVVALDSIEAPLRWRKSNLVDGKWAHFRDSGVEAQLAEMQFVEVQQRLEGLLAVVETPRQVQRKRALQQTIAKVEARLQSLPSQSMVYAASTEFKEQGNFKPTGGTPRPIHLLIRGEVERPGEEVGPGLLPLNFRDVSQLDGGLAEAERRAALAHWLTRPEHPLVGRSIVNRIWQYHFGEGIVSTPNDFGRMGVAPTHPELLDWLACEFFDNGQSMKSLHRLIVTSSVYRQRSQHDEANASIDGNNRFLWRMNRRRLEAEEIRDSILHVSGVMDFAMGGPGFYLFNLERPEHSPHYEYHRFDPGSAASHRRSIYQFLVRSQPNPWMTTLDCADSSQSTPKRNETLTSLQALSLLNSRFNLAMAERFSRRIQQQGIGLESQVELAVRLLVQRNPTRRERDELLVFAQVHGLPNMCRFLFNLSEFVFVD